jgi:hypothetical protein
MIDNGIFDDLIRVIGIDVKGDIYVYLTYILIII